MNMMVHNNRNHGKKEGEKKNNFFHHQVNYWLQVIMCTLSNLSKAYVSWFTILIMMIQHEEHDWVSYIISIITHVVSIV